MHPTYRYIADHNCKKEVLRSGLNFRIETVIYFWDIELFSTTTASKLIMRALVFLVTLALSNIDIGRGSTMITTVSDMTIGMPIFTLNSSNILSIYFWIDIAWYTVKNILWFVINQLNQHVHLMVRKWLIYILHLCRICWLFISQFQNTKSFLI